MARLADGSGSASSNLVNGDDSSLTYRFDATEVLDVESVRATVDNSAGGSAATITLTVKDSSGQVIARKRLSDTIPAGDTGTATFALRLADSGAGIRFDKLEVGDWLDVEATGVGPNGVSMNLTGDQGVNINSNNAGVGVSAVNGVIELDATGGQLKFDCSGGTVQFNCAGAALTITTIPGGSVSIDGRPVSLSDHVLISDSSANTVVEVASTNKLGFFGHAPVTRPAAPTTLADVIAALQTLGLTA